MLSVFGCANRRTPILASISVFTVLTFEKKEKGDLVSVDGDRCSRMLLLCIKKTVFPSFTTSRFPFDSSFFLLLHSHSLCTCSCRGWLKGCFWNRLKSRKSFFFPPSKAIKVVYVYHPATSQIPSTTTRLLISAVDFVDGEEFFFLLFKQDESQYSFLFD